MFLIDKYAPKTIEDAFFHKELLNKLKIMSNDESIPHIIFYGPEGAGKKTIIRLFLEMLYDKEVHNMIDSKYSVIGSGNTTTDVTIKQSNYHIVIDPYCNNFDRYLIQDVVKEYARRMPLDVFTTNKIFKTVLINDVDNLSYYAQTSLRRTMEKYSDTCRFILWCKSLSKVIEPLRSRCICFRIRAPSDEELFEKIYIISASEKINLSLNEYVEILEKANGNIRKALWILESCKFDHSYLNSYDLAIKKIVKLLIKCNIESILNIRELLYKMIVTNIDGTHIIKDIVMILCHNKHISHESKYQIVITGAKYEHKLIRGRRAITQLDGFILNILKIINDHKNNA